MEFSREEYWSELPFPSPGELPDPRTELRSPALLSPVAQTIKSRPAMWETLLWEDPLEKEMATHSSILAWKIPRTEEPGRL